MAWGCAVPGVEAVPGAGAVVLAGLAAEPAAGLEALTPGAAPTPHEAAKSIPTRPVYFRACKSAFMDAYLGQ